MSMRLSIVVPCYNEQEVLPETNRRLLALLDRMQSQAMVSADSGIYYVDDGIRDNTWALIESLAGPDPEEAMHEYGVTLERFDDLPRADAVVAAVAHREYKALAMEDFARKLVKGGAFIDVKACYSEVALREAGLRVWRL